MGGEVERRLRSRWSGSVARRSTGLRWDGLLLPTFAVLAEEEDGHFGGSWGDCSTGGCPPSTSCGVDKALAEFAAGISAEDLALVEESHPIHTSRLQKGRRA